MNQPRFFRFLIVAASVFVIGVFVLGKANRLVAQEGSSPAETARATESDRPNIVLILADDLGYSDLGSYGSEIHTPTLDDLANKGVRFTQFYNTARCWPTRSSLLTGFYAPQVSRDTLPGVPGSGHGNRPEWAPLLPGLLSQANYRSYHSGKWHIDRMPVANGFDHSYWVEDYNRFFHPQVHFRDDQKLPPVEEGSDFYTTDAISDHAIECIAEHQNQFPDRPFFSYVAYLAPHFPLQAPAEDIKRYDGVYDRGWDEARNARLEKLNHSLGTDYQLSDLEPEVGPPYHFERAIDRLGESEVNRELDWNDLTDSQKEFQASKMEVHAAMVDRMDQGIGRIVEHLRKSGALENTVLVFLSDNGASAEIMIRGDRHDPNSTPGDADSFLCLGPGWSSAANTPFRRHKTWVHEGGISSPLIIHWPRGIEQSRVVEDPCHVIDIVPTFLGLAGIDKLRTPTPPIDRPGISLLPAIVGGDAVNHSSLWWYHEGNRALRHQNLKLVAARDQPWELYDLETDRSESHDLSEQQPETVRRLENLWQKQTDAMVQLRTESK